MLEPDALTRLQHLPVHNNRVLAAIIRPWLAGEPTTPAAPVGQNRTASPASGRRMQQAAVAAAPVAPVRAVPQSPLAPGPSPQEQAAALTPAQIRGFFTGEAIMVSHALH